MKRKQLFLRSILVPAILLCGTCAIASAQSNVALVDIGKVFEAHPQFTQQLQQLKVEAEQFKSQSVQLREQMAAKAERLKMLTPGSEEFKQGETALAEELARLEVEKRDAMRKLMQREAQLHYDTYQQVKQIVNQYCNNQGVRLVLRHSEQELDVDNPESVMRYIGNNVVYHAPGRDITAGVIQMVNGTANVPVNNSNR
ncbi:OmpH family outer membrane protein [bacterium]|nr:OmpH family outer membrane protein [bacterium]